MRPHQIDPPLLLRTSCDVIDEMHLQKRHTPVDASPSRAAANERSCHFY